MNNRPPEQPRSEPEIITPGFDEHSGSERFGIFVRVDEHDGVQRIVIRQPGSTAIVVGLLFLCLITFSWSPACFCSRFHLPLPEFCSHLPPG
jgi:hypothetical protein